MGFYNPYNKYRFFLCSAVTFLMDTNCFLWGRIIIYIQIGQKPGLQRLNSLDLIIEEGFN
jgi:hypothetical protein